MAAEVQLPASNAPNALARRGERCRDSAIRGGDLRLRWRRWHGTAEIASNVKATMRAVPLKGLPREARPLDAGPVFLFGLGAVGAVAFEQLARCGVGDLRGVDPDSYGPDSFLTQPSQWLQAGQPKAWVQAERAHAANPAATIRAAVGRAQHVLLRDLRDADVLAAAGDNLELTLWAGRMAAALGKPLVQAAVYGPSAAAIVRGYDLRHPENACPTCGLSLRELQQQTNRSGCDPASAPPGQPNPTRTLPTICATAGQLLAGEVLKWLAGLDELALRGEEYLQSMLTYRSARTSLPRSQTCRAPHRRWKLVDLPTTADQTTPAMLAEQLGNSADPGLLQVRSELPWISYTWCGGCGRRCPVRTFVRPGAALGRCRCGCQLSAVPHGIRSVIPRDDLLACWETPIAGLGLPHGEAVGLLLKERWVYFFTTNAAAGTKAAQQPSNRDQSRETER